MINLANSVVFDSEAETEARSGGTIAFDGLNILGTGADTDASDNVINGPASAASEFLALSLARNDPSIDAARGPGVTAVDIAGRPAVDVAFLGSDDPSATIRDIGAFERDVSVTTGDILADGAPRIFDPKAQFEAFLGGDLSNLTLVLAQSRSFNSTLVSVLPDGRLAYDPNNDPALAAEIERSKNILGSGSADDFIELSFRSSDGSVVDAGYRVEVLDPGGFPYPALSLVSSDPSRDEGDSGIMTFTFTVTRDGAPYGDGLVQWAVSGTGANPAYADDFAGGVLPGGIVEFDGNQRSATLTVEVVGDSIAEPDETFSLELFSPLFLTVDPGSSEATAIIVDDDDVSGPNVVVAQPLADSVGGTEGDDILLLDTSRSAQVVGNDGTDVFVFGLTADDGFRDVAYLRDFAQSRDLIDVSGMGYSLRTLGGNSIITLNTPDRDTLLVTGVTLNADDFTDAWTSGGLL